MTSNEEMAEKLAEKFYGLIEGDVSVSGGELAKLFVTALDQAGLALSEKAKAYISFEPVLPNGKTLADMFVSSDRKPLGTVLDDEDDEEEDDGPDDAGDRKPLGTVLDDEDDEEEDDGPDDAGDRKPLGTVIDDEDDEEEDDGPDDAGELDELEHMRDVADMAYAALSDLALHCHNRREDVAWGIASSAAKDAHVLATFVGDWIEDMEDED
ncbi:hypothetical protein I010019E5_16920 [Bifidobacterium adolescentis]